MDLRAALKKKVYFFDLCLGYFNLFTDFVVVTVAIEEN